MKTVRKLKAVSPVIATLLLIAISVAAGIILYVFVSGFTGSLTAVAPPTAASAQAKFVCLNPARTRITIEITNGSPAEIRFTKAEIAVRDGTGKFFTITNAEDLDTSLPTTCDPTSVTNEDIKVAAGASEFVEIEVDADPATTGLQGLPKGQTFTISFVNVSDANGNPVTIGSVTFKTPTVG